MVKSDGSIWFTDPIFGILGYYEGYKATPEVGQHIYRIDGETGAASVVADDVLGPNGLCFAPDESLLPTFKGTKRTRGIFLRKVLSPSP